MDPDTNLKTNDILTFDPNKHCHDCGSRPAWRWRNGGHPHYCEMDLNKGGDASTVTISIEELAALVGDETTTRILRAAGYFAENEGPKEH